MKYFSVPADFKEQTIHDLYLLNKTYKDNRVHEVYGQLTEGTLINSGRMVNFLPSIDLKQLEDYVRLLKKKDINFNYTLNPACFGNFEFSEKGISDISDFLSTLYEIGITKLTLTSPALMEIATAHKYSFDIKASAICEINSAHKAAFYKKLGCERIVVDPDITRDFRHLNHISQIASESIEIIINNVCVRNCPYKMFHYNHEAHCNKNNKEQTIHDYYINRCSLQKADSLVNVMKMNWIRPEDMHVYEEHGIKYYKIQGRQNVCQGDLIKCLKAYMEEKYDGDLFALITIFAPYNSFQPFIENKALDGFIDKFVKHPESCSGICEKCGYCIRYAEKAINVSEHTYLNKKATDYFKGADTLQNVLINSQKDYSFDDIEDIIF